MLGQSYHKIGPLLPFGHKAPSYASLYIIDPKEALNKRLKRPLSQNVKDDILEQLQNCFGNHNPYVRYFRHMYEVLHDKEKFVVHISFNIIYYLVITTNVISLCYKFSRANIDGRPLKEVSLYFYETHGKTSIRPTAPKISAAVAGGDHPAGRHHQVYPRLAYNKLLTVSILSPDVDPMIYPLFFPYGEPGFR